MAKGSSSGATPPTAPASSTAPGAGPNSAPGAGRGQAGNPRHLRRAYRAGRARGERGDSARPAWLDRNDIAPEWVAAYEQGQADAAPDAAPEGASEPTSAPRARRVSGRVGAGSGPVGSAAQKASRSFPLPIPGDAGGFLLGLIGYALFYNFLQGGPAQVRGWLASKFLNKPYGQVPEGSAPPSSPGVGGASAGSRPGQTPAPAPGGGGSWWVQR